MRTVLITITLLLSLPSAMLAGEPGVTVKTEPCRSCQASGTVEAGCQECYRLREMARAKGQKYDPAGCALCKGRQKETRVCQACQGRGYQVLGPNGDPAIALTQSMPENEQSIRLKGEVKTRQLEAKIARLEADLAAAKAELQTEQQAEQDRRKKKAAEKAPAQNGPTM